MLVPCDTLSQYEDRKFTSKDFDPYNLVLFFSNFLSKVVQNQELVK